MNQTKLFTVNEIITAWLKENGFDGLAGSCCGCTLDDIMPCELCHPIRCVAAYKVKMPKHLQTTPKAIMPGDSSEESYEYFLCTEKNVDIADHEPDCQCKWCKFVKEELI